MNAETTTTMARTAVNVPRDGAQRNGRSVGTLPPSRRLPRVVALGGGTGLPVVLEGLKAVLFPPGWEWVPTRDAERLTGIVTAADDGGSSGRLRRAYGVQPPGDVRNCLLALSDKDPTLAAIFNYRFDGDGDLGGHSLGNLILTALSDLERDFQKAVQRASELLGIRGQVYASTPDDVVLVADFHDGSQIVGESRIATVRRPIRHVSLRPDTVRALPRARKAVAAADLVVIGPGSLYTSLIPTLLVKDLARAISQSRARVVLVMNLMTEPGETDDYTASDVLLAIRRHVPELSVHEVLLNAAPLPADAVERYVAEGAHPVRTRLAPLAAMGCRPVERDLVGPGPHLRHDPHKLARALVELSGGPGA
jgi:uncharacterized cofD-like protein